MEHGDAVDLTIPGNHIRTVQDDRLREWKIVFVQFQSIFFRRSDVAMCRWIVPIRSRVTQALYAVAQNSTFFIEYQHYAILPLLCHWLFV